MENLSSIQKSTLNLFLKEVKGHELFKIQTSINGESVATNYNSYSFKIFKSMILEFIKGHKSFYSIEIDIYVPKDESPEDTTYTSAELRLSQKNINYYFRAVKY